MSATVSITVRWINPLQSSGKLKVSKHLSRLRCCSSEAKRGTMTSTIIAAITTAAHEVVMETPSKNGQGTFAIHWFFYYPGSALICQTSGLTFKHGYFPLTLSREHLDSTKHQQWFSQCSEWSRNFPPQLSEEDTRLTWLPFRQTHSRTE